MIPTAPANALVLCQVAVAANATTVSQSNVTDARPVLTNGPDIYTPIAASGTAAVAALSGYNVIVSSGSPPITLPVPYKTARVLVTNFGTGNPTVAQHSSEKIYGLGCGSGGVNSFWLAAAGGSAELRSDGTSWYIVAGNPGWLPGTLLGSLSYRGASDTVYTVTATTLTAVDTTNLRLTVLAPPDGNMRARWSANMVVNNAIANVYGGVLNGASNLGSGIVYASSSAGGRILYEQLFTGLTAGTSYPLDLAAYTSNATDSIAISHGPTNGPIDYSLTAA